MDVTDTVDAYVAAWNEPDRERRTEVLEPAFGPGGTYRDPRFSVDGLDALVEHIGGYQQRFAGSRMERRSGVDAYGDVLRFAWAIVGPDGEVALEGVDFIALDDGGRIRSVTGFFGPLA